MEYLRYTLLGSGTAVPDAERGPSGHWFACGGLRVLCDLGSGTARRIQSHGHHYDELDLIAVTHRHQDHIADLLPILFALKYIHQLGDGPERVDPLTIVGYDGLKGDLEKLSLVYGRWVIDPGFPVEVIEADDTPVEMNRGDSWVQVEAFPVRHTAEAVGYRISMADGGRETVVAYTGDTEECDEVVDLARDADLLIAECSVADEDRVKGHLTPGAVGRIAAAAAVRHVVTTHMYPSSLELGASEIERRIVESFARGPVDVGYDGLEIEL